MLSSLLFCGPQYVRCWCWELKSSRAESWECLLVEGGRVRSENVRIHNRYRVRTLPTNFSPMRWSFRVFIFRRWDGLDTTYYTATLAATLLHYYFLLHCNNLTSLTDFVNFKIMKQLLKRSLARHESCAGKHLFTCADGVHNRIGRMRTPFFQLMS